jgi:hypothetical protein
MEIIMFFGLALVIVIPAVVLLQPILGYKGLAGLALFMWADNISQTREVENKP